jgi:membrane protein
MPLDTEAAAPTASPIRSNERTHGDKATTAVERSPRSPRALLGHTWSAFNQDNALRLAAAIAFSTIFSIAPLFVIIIAVVGWVIGAQNGGHGHTAAENMLLGTVRANAGEGAADSVRQLVATSFGKPRQSMIAEIVGWLAFIVGASALFSALQGALNSVWHVEATKGGWKQMVRDRIASFVMILFVGLLLVTSIGVNIAIGFFTSATRDSLPILSNPLALAVVGQVVSVCALTGAFALLFKVLPDVDITWRDVAIGSVATAVLFTLGEAAIGLYFRLVGEASAYGASGSLLVALLWIYYSAILLLLGAEFTKVYAGSVRTTVPTTVRILVDHPTGIDPRTAARDGAG